MIGHWYVIPLKINKERDKFVGQRIKIKKDILTVILRYEKSMAKAKAVWCPAQANQKFKKQMSVK